MIAIFVGLAGVLGALLRFALDSFFAQRGRFAHGQAHHFPLATLSVNVLGSFIIGMAGGFASHAELSPEWHSAISIGIAGGLTTYSSFAVATVSLWQLGHKFSAMMNIGLNLVLGLGAAWLGLSLAA